MNKEKVLSNQTQKNCFQEKTPDIHSLEASAAGTEILKKLYLPSSKADNSPSEESVERANGLTNSRPDTLV